MTSKPVVTISDVSSTRAPDRIRVFLRDCRTDIRVGIYTSEMQEAQPVVINVEVEAALPHRYQDLTEKKLGRVIDYEAIYNYIQKTLPEIGHIPLLETVAEQIIAFCFRDIRIEKVTVRLEKTAVFAHAAGAGIEISRSRTSELS